MRLEDYSRIWDNKIVLREYYHTLHRWIELQCVDLSSPSIEIGSGASTVSFSKIKNVIRTDIQTGKLVDVSFDATKIPLRDSSFSNVIGFDVLHHISFPLEFLQEAHRVLKPGGRLVFIEPFISPTSYIFYKLAHHEPVDLAWNPWLQRGSSEDPYDSNQAIPTIMLRKSNVTRIQRELGFGLVGCWYGGIVYPLTGGFKKWSLVNSSTLRFLLGLENMLPHFLKRILSFRVGFVFEKK